MTHPILLLQEFEPLDQIIGPFYVIENFPFPQFVTDQEGNLKEFEDYLAALDESEDCQEGYVIAF